LNTFYGNGAATSKANATTSNNFGLGLLGVSQDNLIENNKLGGNVNGVYLGGGGQVTGNVIRRNVIAGNPPAQVIVTFGRAIGADIQNFEPAGANTFDDNYCLTYAGAGPSPCPSVRPKHDKEEDRDQRASRLGARDDAISMGLATLKLLWGDPAAFVNTVFHSGHMLPLISSAPVRPRGD
jgi:hypothetical protein